MNKKGTNKQYPKIKIYFADVKKIDNLAKTITKSQIRPSYSNRSEAEATVVGIMYRQYYPVNS